MEQILLHCCCAPCSSAIIEWMLANGVRPTLFYCNPNIYPEQEYLIRKNECTKYAHKLGLEIIDDDYNHDAWLNEVCGLEDEPERGKRCLQCFKMRLLRAAAKTKELGFATFTTTLASSRWKSLDQINEAGKWAAEQVGGVRFNDRNWRKGGLQQRRNELLKENGFYNQLYCGCEFSLRAAQEKERKKNTVGALLLTLLVSLMLVGCSKTEDIGNLLSQHRVWSMRKITYCSGVSYDYPNANGTYLAIYENDSTRYECHWSFNEEAETILPQIKSQYSLINKGGGGYLYFEDGKPCPLRVLNDTTITIQHNGIVYTWQPEHSIDKRKMAEIHDLLVGLDYEDGRSFDRHVFTKKEHELEEQKSMLGYYLAAAMLIIAIGAFLFLRTYLNKKRIEAELLRLRTEREERPQIVTEALKNVEEEWLTSDEYARLRKQIESGELSYDDWSLMERQLNKVYPSFTHTLESLHHMSLMEHRVCMLIKFRATPSEMAAVLNKEVSTISTTRSRLHEKIFGKKGGAKDWDEFVLGL